jgi:hypothetical protein
MTCTNQCGCTPESLALIEAALSCQPNAYCPPCVAALEVILTALIDSNTTRIAAIEDGIADSILAGWLYNT